jgi:hypothetical protein
MALVQVRVQVLLLLRVPWVQALLLLLLMP